jgi:hypothetical protein
MGRNKKLSDAEFMAAVTLHEGDALAIARTTGYAYDTVRNKLNAIPPVHRHLNCQSKHEGSCVGELRQCLGCGRLTCEYEIGPDDDEPCHECYSKLMEESLAKLKTSCQSDHEGPCRGELWQCSECKRWLPFSNGQDDDFPGWCDECWTAHDAAKRERTPVPEWFADGPPPTVCVRCGWPLGIGIPGDDHPELCNKCYMNRSPFFEATDTMTIRQQLLDAFCSPYARSNMWLEVFDKLWSGLED